MADPVEGEGAGEVVTLALDSESALVLFDLLAREIDCNDGRRLTGLCGSEAELWALNSLFCTLESRLAAPFAQDSETLFAAAGARLLARCGPWPGAEDGGT